MADFDFLIGTWKIEGEITIWVLGDEDKGFSNTLIKQKPAHK
jgi:hypothetical protein